LIDPDITDFRTAKFDSHIDPDAYSVRVNSLGEHGFLLVVQPDRRAAVVELMVTAFFLASF
jgi:hypothetical protein